MTTTVYHHLDPSCQNRNDALITCYSKANYTEVMTPFKSAIVLAK
jgi:hypothetical protein